MPPTRKTEEADDTGEGAAETEADDKETAYEETESGDDADA